MNFVRFDLNKTTGARAYATITARPLKRGKNGPTLILRETITCEHPGEPVVMTLPTMGEPNAWNISISGAGDNLSGFYLVPNGESAFTDLSPVDPNTLEPDASPDPAWVEMAKSTINAGLVDSQGSLILRRTDGKTVNAGRVKGEPGKDGAPGRAGTPGRDGEDGRPGKDGVDGAPGRDGVDGKDGAPGKDAVLLSGDPYKYVIDESAGRVVRVWDYRNNREQLIYGDTGTRNISSLLVNTTGSAYLTRQGNTVTLDLAGVVPASTLNSGSTFLTLPSGFRPTIRRDLPLPANNAGSVSRSMFIFMSGGLGVWLPNTSDSYRLTLTFPTVDPWPTTLPGVAA